MLISDFRTEDLHIESFLLPSYLIQARSGRLRCICAPTQTFRMNLEGKHLRILANPKTIETAERSNSKR